MPGIWYNARSFIVPDFFRMANKAITQTTSKITNVSLFSGHRTWTHWHTAERVHTVEGFVFMSEFLKSLIRQLGISHLRHKINTYECGRTADNPAISKERVVNKPKARVRDAGAVNIAVNYASVAAKCFQLSDTWPNDHTTQLRP